MSQDNDTHMAAVKMTLAWLGTLFGGFSLSTAVLATTLVFTVLQIYVLVRKIRREARIEAFEAKLKQPLP